MLRHLQKSDQRQVARIKENKEFYYQERYNILRMTLSIELDVTKCMVYEVPDEPVSRKGCPRNEYCAAECADYITGQLAAEGFFARKIGSSIFICWDQELYAKFKEEMPDGPEPVFPVEYESSDEGGENGKVSGDNAQGNKNREEKNEEVGEEDGDEDESHKSPGPENDRKRRKQSESVNSDEAEEVTRIHFVELDGSAFKDRAKLSEYLSRKRSQP